jgi:hypothetical protein
LPGASVGDPGHSLSFSIRETDLDIVGHCISDEKVVDLVHHSINIDIKLCNELKAITE